MRERKKVGGRATYSACSPKFRSQPPTQEPEPQGGLTPDFLALSKFGIRVKVLRFLSPYNP